MIASMIVGDGFQLEISNELGERVSSRNDRVTAGIRPSSFHKDSNVGSPIELSVVVSEYLGAQSVLVTRCGAGDVLVEYDSASPIPRGGTMTFGVLPGDIMLFDPETGASL